MSVPPITGAAPSPPPAPPPARRAAPGPVAVGPLPHRHHDACGIGFGADTSGEPSRWLVEAALEGLARVRHRGAVASDSRTSDGTGVLTPIPARLFGAGTGVAMLFVSPGAPDPTDATNRAAAAEGLEVTGWRTPPTDPGALGELARLAAPEIRQCLLAAPAGWDGNQRERAAYRLRRRLGTDAPGTYVASCSFRTITYKGLAAADALAGFYRDLASDDYTASFAMFHQRFSTNTQPSWERAQPFRGLCHNGEVNTISGNANHLAGRGVFGTVAAGLGDEDLFHPLVDPEDSDSGMLDEAVELLVRGGRSAPHAVAMLIPEAWEGARDLAAGVRGFYAYHSALSEPWDGPAGVVFTDGIGVGAALDRNGLRPLRWAVCSDGLVAASSEAGAIDTTGHGTVRRGRLGPGRMLWVGPDPAPTVAPGTPGSQDSSDVPRPRVVLHDRAIKDALAGAAPYATWAEDGFLAVHDAVSDDPVPDDLRVRQACFGYTREELAMVLRPMAEDAHEPTFSMGDDSPLPNLAGRPRPVHHYLRQRFAQVTNPPIDPLRERLVMSTRTLIGPRAPLLSGGPEATQLLALESFLVHPGTVEQLTSEPTNPFGHVTLDATFATDLGPAGLAGRLGELVDAAVAAVGTAGVIVVDNGGISATRAPVPGALAVGAIHQALVARGVRESTSVVACCDDARDVHEVAVLVGYGADVVCPRLALATVASEADSSDSADLVGPEARQRLLAALEAGVLKIMSKMGIATIDAYRGAQLFDSIGLDADVVRTCFGSTCATMGGVGFADLGADVLANHAHAYPGAASDTGGDDEPTLASPGYYRVRKGGEPHGKSKEVVEALNDLAASNPPSGDQPGGDQPARERVTLSVAAEAPEGDTSESVAAMASAHLLQRAIRANSTELYDTFARTVNERTPLEPHDLLGWEPAGPAVGLEEVEPPESIVTRFSTGAMSHGALSAEAHETLARAMNLLGARSNCGEGGEDPARFRTRGQGRDDTNSRTKQVASGRFGVTPEYLAHADEIQIKMAQGSKPGEGGQLPGHKVTTEIARLRHTQPGVGLISPPPHHDIYSIEDLAQLIFDLKQVNAAEVSVKLVATEGVGTIAAGVAKALADTVHISGANGGTGASPLSSIKHAGMPWELGLAEAHQTLVANDLRHRVRLCVDGGFLTGRQVVTAALLGADNFSFGTAAMIAEGCIMLRACHRDTCKPGVATQRPQLRANFIGTPEGVATYFLFVAGEVRAILAELGLRSLDEAVGRTDLLVRRPSGDARVDALDPTALLAPPPSEGGPARHFVARTALQDPRSDLGDRLAADAFRALWEGDHTELHYPITNADRAVGAALGGAVALEFGTGAPLGSVVVHLDGAAGQSLGAFITAGVELRLTGEANDYVGKGMGGGRIVVVPPANDASIGAGDPSDTPAVLAGNTCLYGATGGEVFIAGAVGERFAVRNSGADAVVEAVGDHCCEYMTGGTVVVLGRIGYNFGAGMTGGRAFVWDPEIDRLAARVNQDLVELERPDIGGLAALRWLVEAHAEATGSLRATRLLDNWEAWSDQLWAVVPRRSAERVRSQQARRVQAA